MLCAEVWSSACALRGEAEALAAMLAVHTIAERALMLVVAGKMVACGVGAH